MELIKAINITKTYSGKAGANDVKVLRGVAIEFSKGSMSAIIGSSGSGKSTLLHILGGLDKPTTGQIYFKDQDISSYSSEEISLFRNQEIGFVFQFHHLLPEFTALENVMMPGLARNFELNSVKKRATELLSEFGLSDRLSHRPGMLSGGEQQRVSMARALINSPSVLLADEPTGNLDEANTMHLMDLITGLNKSTGLTVIMVTHDSNLARVCDIQISLKNGVVA
ncbi:MAG: ABC transporter ATP-binding protein [Bacteroidetes bacterium]|nr:ABC transporter ATP-binding protein [Bacteroidota bacterium]MCH8523236.1 ABC transporter ATP-binding protein [Balneolales bacterium]